MVELSQLSSNAVKLLKHFQDRQLGQRIFETPANQRALFSDVEDCEAAQTELAGLGLLELTRIPPNPNDPDRVVAAALPLDGIRFLKKNPIS